MAGGGTSEAQGLDPWEVAFSFPYLLVVEVRRATAEGQHRRVAQRLAHRETAQKDVALQERGHQGRRSPGGGGGGRGGSGRGRTHLQDVGEAVLELVPAQPAAVHKHLPSQGPCAPQPPGDGVQQRGFPRAWGGTREGSGGVSA